MIKITDEVRQSFKEIIDLMKEYGSDIDSATQKLKYTDKRLPKYEFEIQLIVRIVENDEIQQEETNQPQLSDEEFGRMIIETIRKNYGEKPKCIN